MQLSMNDFAHAIRKCRSKETSGDPERRSDTNPSHRQCLGTALLANQKLWFDIYSEKIVFEDNKIEHHYFNKDEEGNSVCFCEEQFIYEKVITRKKSKLKSKERISTVMEEYPGIKKRYEILTWRFQEEIVSLFRYTDPL